MANKHRPNCFANPWRKGKEEACNCSKGKKQCPTKTPEPHLLGEFPMTCHQCHIYADS